MKLKPSDPIRDIGPDEPLRSPSFSIARQVGDQVYEAAKRHRFLELPPGTSISENRICRQIGVSRTPVREAIIRLVEDGLIEVFPQKGSFVAPIKFERGAQQSFHPQGARTCGAAEAAASWSADRAANVQRQTFGCTRRRALDDDVWTVP